MNKVCIGDQVRWESGLGVLRGEIVSMDLARNAKGDLVPWLIIEYHDPRWNRLCKVRLCGLEDNLLIMKFKVIFRDGGVEAA